MEKKFLFKDKTGRGIKSTLSEAQLKNIVASNDEDENTDWTTDQTLQEFYDEAEIGDEFETRTTKFTRTQ